MGAEKISVSVDAEELATARRRAGSRQLSAYVNEALRSENQRRGQLAFLADLDRQFGPIPEDHPDAEKGKRLWQQFVSSWTPEPSRHSRKATSPRGRFSVKR